ncbi:MAG: bifunctional hydroxymethylpyrimidine kinase/phosphomethylpyrimidine kinase [Solirubrobacteraceae bacterium]
MNIARRIPRVLSIAGSDSGGGAGIQADLKAFAACGVHGMTAITAITAQSTVGVTAIHAVPPEVIVAQVLAVVQDIGVDAVKIGMLGTPETVRAVADGLAAVPAHVPVVIDPVMVAESGAALLDSPARAALIERLLPRATVLTPNLPEAKALAASAPSARGTGTEPAAGAPAGTEPAVDAAALARAVRELGPAYIVITGGHREVSSDLFFDGREIVEIGGPRHPDGAAHGSGCTHSSVLAACLAWGYDPLRAARVAKQMASQAVLRGLRELGAGAGPVDVLDIASHALNPQGVISGR